MTEHEVERLVVRLTGDGSQYQTMLQEARTSTQAAATQIAQSVSRVEASASNLTGVLSGAIGLLGSLGFGAWLREGLGEWQTAEDTALKLEAAIRSNGRAVESTMASYNEFATEMERITVLGDDTILAALRTAESFNLTGDAAERVTQNAIAMNAAATGSVQGFESLIRITAALERGDIQTAMSMARMVPQLRGIRDQSEFVAKAQQLIASGMATATAEANSSSGAIKQLKNAYGNLMEEVGKVVAETIAPIVAGVKATVEWFQKLPGPVKEGIVVIAILTAVAVAFWGAMILGAKIFNVLTGGVLILLGVLVTAGLAISGWVISIGGVKSAWDAVKETVSRLYNWLLPIFRAIGGVGAAIWNRIVVAATKVWELIVRGWNAVKTFLSGILGGIFGDFTLTWDDIRRGAAIAFIAVEFYLDNIGSIFEFTWLGIRLGWEVTTSFILHFFQTVVPAVLTYFSNNWRAIFVDAFTLVTVGFQNLLRNAETVGRSIPRLLARQIRLDDINWTPLLTGFQRTVGRLVIPQRVISENERRLRTEFEAMGNNLMERWDEFRERRLQEIFSETEATAQANRPNPITPMLTTAQEVTREIQRWDAAARFSAESFQRIQEYADRIRGGASPQAARGGGEPIASPSSPRPVEQQRPGGDAQTEGWRRVAELLVLTNTHLQTIVNRPGVNLVPANLQG